MTRGRTETAHGRRATARAAPGPVRPAARAATLRRFFRENGLSIAFVTMFLLALFAGQGLAGLNDYNSERLDHGLPEVGYGAYLRSPHFIEALAENWESEFLEMMLFATLTALLFQKGSAESRELACDPEDEEAAAKRPDAPWPVRRGGWIKEALVPVVPELAERVPRDLDDGPLLDLAPPSWIGGVEAGRRTALEDREGLKRRSIPAPQRKRGRPRCPSHREIGEVQLTR